jgi:hypothetical protein
MVSLPATTVEWIEYLQWWLRQYGGVLADFAPLAHTYRGHSAAAASGVGDLQRSLQIHFMGVERSIRTLRDKALRGDNFRALGLKVFYTMPQVLQRRMARLAGHNIDDKNFPLTWTFSSLKSVAIEALDEYWEELKSQDDLSGLTAFLREFCVTKGGDASGARGANPAGNVVGNAVGNVVGNAVGNTDGNASGTAVGKGKSASKAAKPKGCYVCGVDGHRARDCPTTSATAGASAVSATPTAAGAATSAAIRSTPVAAATTTGGAFVDASQRTCYHCKVMGHIAKECPTLVCRKCNKKGHFANSCPEP